MGRHKQTVSAPILFLPDSLVGFIIGATSLIFQHPTLSCLIHLISFSLNVLIIMELNDLKREVPLDFVLPSIKDLRKPVKSVQG